MNAVKPLSPEPAAPTDCSSIANALVQTLLELRTLLTTLTKNQFAAPLGSLFANSSIGAHVRHSFDHARALADGWLSGTVDYDHRARGTCIETDPAAADAELSRLIDSVQKLADLDRDDRVDVCVLPSRGGQFVTVSSTIARELVFVLSHTIHHAATIRSMAQSLGAIVPESFGCAPSTLAHKDRCAGATCAQ